MTKFFVLCFASVALLASGCASTPKVATTDAPKSTGAASAPVQRMPRYYFLFTSSGFSDRPSDAIRLDTTGTMNFETRKKLTDGSWHTVKGMAIIEPQDYDTLRTLIEQGNLLTLDPTDLATNCPSGEAYSLTLGSTATQPSRVQYTACAIDYNLLLKPQRANFVELAHWFDRMRVKYRPAMPQE